jgi:hypothetical protein
LTLPENGILAQWVEEGNRQDELKAHKSNLETWADIVGKELEKKEGSRLEAYYADAKKLLPLVWVYDASSYNAQRLDGVVKELQDYINVRDVAKDADPQDAIKGNGGQMTFKQIEDHLSMPDNQNGNMARRAVKRHEKKLQVA